VRLGVAGSVVVAAAAEASSLGWGSRTATPGTSAGSPCTGEFYGLEEKIRFHPKRSAVCRVPAVLSLMPRSPRRIVRIGDEQFVSNGRRQDGRHFIEVVVKLALSDRAHEAVVVAEPEFLETLHVSRSDVAAES